MGLEVNVAGLLLDGRAVGDAASVADVLGDPDRREVTDRTVPGLDDRATTDVHVWDGHGVMAGDGFVAVAVGPNVLEEPIWPQRPYDGGVTLAGRELDPTEIPMDPLHGDRRTTQVGRHQVIVVVDWDGTPGKVVAVPSP